MNDFPRIAAVLLAAGASSRMGAGDKLLLRAGGRSIFEWSLGNVLNSRVSEVLIVAGEAFATLRRLAASTGARVLHNARYREGMSASLKLGIQAVSQAADGAIVLLADQPNLKSDTIDLFLDRFRRSGKRIVAARYGQTTGNPVLFHQQLFAELLRIQGDQGARAILQQNPDDVETVGIPPEQSLDVDTPEDFLRIKRILERPASGSEFS